MWNSCHVHGCDTTRKAGSTQIAKAVHVGAVDGRTEDESSEEKCFMASTCLQSTIMWGRILGSGFLSDVSLTFKAVLSILALLGTVTACKSRWTVFKHRVNGCSECGLGGLSQFLKSGPRA